MCSELFCNSHLSAKHKKSYCENGPKETVAVLDDIGIE